MRKVYKIFTLFSLHELHVYVYITILKESNHESASRIFLLFFFCKITIFASILREDAQKIFCRTMVVLSNWWSNLYFVRPWILPVNSPNIYMKYIHMIHKHTHLTRAHVMILKLPRKLTVSFSSIV